MASLQKLTSCLWFDGQAEDAAKFYVSVFRNAKLGRISHDLRVAENGMEKQNHQGDSSVRVNGQSGERAERVASTPKPDAATRPESSDSGRAMGTARTEGVPRVNLPDVSQMNRPGRH